MGLNIITAEAKETTYGPIKEVQVNDGRMTVMATIWKKQKDGTDFPGFDTIGPGSIIEGNLWNKPGTDKWSIFPMKPKAQGSMGAGAAKAIAMKDERITKSMDRKDETIRQSSTFRAAYEITLAQLSGQEFQPEDFKKAAAYWRRWAYQFFDDKLTSSGTEMPSFDNVPDPEPTVDWPN